MNKIEVKCYINGEPEMGNSSLYLSKTEPWDQVVYKISLKVNRPQSSSSLVYNELGGQVTSVADLEDGDKVFFAVLCRSKVAKYVFGSFLHVKVDSSLRKSKPQLPRRSRPLLRLLLLQLFQRLRLPFLLLLPWRFRLPTLRQRLPRNSRDRPL